MPGSSNDHLRADGRREVLGGAPHKMTRVRLDEFREDEEEPQRRAVPKQDVPREVPSALFQRDDDDDDGDDYDYSKLAMDVDSDSDGNDAGM